MNLRGRMLSLKTQIVSLAEKKKKIGARNLSVLVIDRNLLCSFCLADGMSTDHLSVKRTAVPPLPSQLSEQLHVLGGCKSLAFQRRSLTFGWTDCEEVQQTDLTDCVRPRQHRRTPSTSDTDTHKHSK